ncbi:DUF3597 domain-containing protein [Rhizobium tumorigenes]|uniref:DUF3597 domain-containing protein n=1 Tax=Rhizobium tumorigenes TaxID=2041385 RepID=A0AAF1KU15_9HYPH|nr:DUF3597 domain-containing protein [Rhizobium tumorigenes]WFR99036.1 DUF3597 domain-containing protein [Rhizobium tumorigenes]
MSIFDRIKNAIFGQAQAAGTTQASTGTTTAAATPVSNPAPGTATPVPSAPSAATLAQSVDVAPILDAAVQKSGQKLDWKHSIVDLMKALGMDASLEERKELAAELNFQGDVHDSAKMNTFLHKALLQKLSENGGKVPAELLD